MGGFVSQQVQDKFSQYSLIQGIKKSKLGSYAIIQENESHLKYFLKVKTLPMDTLSTYTNHLDKQSQVNHPNILKLLKYRANTSFEETTSQVFVTYENIQNTLKEDIEQRTTSHLWYSEEELWQMIKESVQALACLQEQELYVDNISAETIFFNIENQQVKFIDLRHFKDNELYYDLLNHNDYNTTGLYMAPDVLENLKDARQTQNFNPYQTGVFSLACVMVEAASLKQVNECFDYDMCEVDNERLFNRINELRSDYSTEIVNLLLKMTSTDEVYDFKRLAVLVQNKHRITSQSPSPKANNGPVSFPKVDLNIQVQSTFPEDINLQQTHVSDQMGEFQDQPDSPVKENNNEFITSNGNLEISFESQYKLDQQYEAEQQILADRKSLRQQELLESPTFRGRKNRAQNLQVSIVQKQKQQFDIVNEFRPQHLSTYMDKFELESYQAYKRQDQRSKSPYQCIEIGAKKSQARYVSPLVDNRSRFNLRDIGIERQDQD